MSEWADFSEKSMKTCFVVLEKLDDRLVNQYLQKCGLKKTTNNVDFIKNIESHSVNKNTINCNCCIKTTKNPQKNGRHKRENSGDSAIKSELIRKKRKTKTLDYNDVLNKSVFEKKEPVTEDDKNTKFRVSSNAADNREESCSKLNKTHEYDKSVTMKCKEKSRWEVEEKTNKVILKTLLEDLGRNSSENHTVALSTADNEIEVVEEYLNRRSIPENRNCDKTEASCKKEQIFANDDPVQAKGFEEDEYDSREDNEDDKKTVIFEEGFHKDRNLDIFDIEEKEIELDRRKLKTREITNRKIQKLIQFKIKGVESRSLDIVSNPEAKVMEPSTGQEASEVPHWSQNVSENHFEEVCCLVQRLHELYKIIMCMQMKLQNNNRLSVHFSNAINFHQEQFQREIRKNQKTIIKCYEKMLLSYKNAGKVALIISERTSLSAKEVIEVISQCLLVEGACQLKKSKKKSIQKAGKGELFQPSKASYNSDSSRKTFTEDFERLNSRKMVQKTNYFEPPSNFYFPPGKNPELYQRVPNESMPVLRTLAVENSENCSQNLPDRVIGTVPIEHQMQKIDQGELKSFTVKKQIIQKLQSKNLMKNSRIDQSQQRQCPRLIVLPYNGQPINQSVILSYSKFDCPTNVCRFQQDSFLTMPSTPIGSTELPFPGQFLNCDSKNSSTNHVGLSNTDISNSGSRVLIPAIPGNNVQYNILSRRNNLLNRAFPSETYRGTVNAQRQILECSQVLDPTVPKKLTMKNWRLQAGPILDPEIKEEKATEPRDKLNPYQSLGEKNLDCHKLGSPDQEDSKSREYICAQRDCRKPGVRICGGCQSIIYCSEICQLKNWTQKHMVECYQLKKLRG